MFKSMSFTDNEILRKTKPEQLFTAIGFSVELKRLRGKWHPDQNKSSNAKDVFSHIGHLADVARIKLKTKTWEDNSDIYFTTAQDKTFRFSYIKMHDIDIGKMYIGKEKIVYVIDESREQLFKRASSIIKGFKYIDNKFKKEFSKLMPSIIFESKTNIGFVMVINKPKNAILLQDLLDYLPDNKLDAKHGAWIGSCLYNISLFLNYNNICHNGIQTTSIFIDPATHATFLLGGWWYSSSNNNKVFSLPGELLNILPKEIRKTKKSKNKYDRMAINALIIKSLGDNSLNGSKLLTDPNIPKPMVTWLRATSGDSPLDDYTNWYEVLKESFGKRRFTILDVNITDVY